jgi:hypothetical protein
MLVQSALPMMYNACSVGLAYMMYNACSVGLASHYWQLEGYPYFHLSTCPLAYVIFLSCNSLITLFYFLHNNQVPKLLYIVVDIIASMAVVISVPAVLIVVLWSSLMFPGKCSV